MDIGNLRNRRGSGFSLIEILIAVVVLATGLLALTTLQGRLAQASADAKVRSRVASMLSSRMDELRAAQYDNTALNAGTGGSATTTSTCVSGAPAWLCLAETQSALAAGSLTVTQSLQRFTSAIGSDFSTTPNGAIPANRSIPEFKRITLTATWTDASAQSRRLSISSDVSSLSLGSGLIPNPPDAATGGSSPLVRQENPTGAGMIPIAVGNNTDTAATNPKPELGSESANQSLPSTRFDVLTYQNESGGSAVIQKRVETTVVACVCKNSNNPAELTGYLAQETYRPTYWDGTRYAPPERLSATSIQSGPYTANGDIKQSDLCTQCCRDHRDASSDTVKYNNLNTDYNRYQVSYTAAVTTGPPASRRPANIEMVRSGANLVPAGNNQAYADACRVVRTDGMWRIAADAEAVHMGMVATTAQGYATSPLPDPSAATRYEDFVKDYLGETARSKAGQGVMPDAVAKYEAHNMNDPDSIPSTTGAHTFLHARGLYLDHLEPVAIAKLQSVWDNCSATSRPSCLLPFLPFTAINVTELGSWVKNPSATTVLTTVTNGSGSIITGNGLTPIRGEVTAGTAGGASGDVSANVSLGRSNSALAASLLDINPYDANPLNDWVDAQKYIVTGGSASGQFYVTLSDIAQVGDLSTTNDPLVGWGINTATSDCMTSISRSDLNPNPYNCVTTTPLTSTVNVILGGYNLREQRTVTNPCGGSDTVQRTYLVCSAVDSASIASPAGFGATMSVTGVQTTAERATVTLVGSASMPNGSTVGISFVPNGESGGTYTCDAVTQQPTFTPATSCSQPTQ